MGPWVRFVASVARALVAVFVGVFIGDGCLGLYRLDFVFTTMRPVDVLAMLFATYVAAWQLAVIWHVVSGDDERERQGRL